MTELLLANERRKLYDGPILPEHSCNVNEPAETNYWFINMSQDNMHRPTCHSLTNTLGYTYRMIGHKLTNRQLHFMHATKRNIKEKK